jgi:thiol-disulfide isomerase/thioredoxin
VGVILLGLLGCGAPSGPTIPSEEKPSGEEVKTSSERPAETKISLQTIKYEQLTAAIRALRGKVVVVDIWASWCGPCKEEFPHLVELHEKYAKDGFVAISVSIDQPEQTAAALKFLKKVKATFTNYRLDEEFAVWQEKWDISAVPAVFVFDRNGKRAGKFTKDDPANQFTYPKNVLPLVARLIAAKG